MSSQSPHIALAQRRTLGAFVAQMDKTSRTQLKNAFPGDGGAATSSLLVSQQAAEMLRVPRIQGLCLKEAGTRLASGNQPAGVRAGLMAEAPED